MSAVLAPNSAEELSAMVRAAPRVLAVGAGTKPRLTGLDCQKISTARLTGIIEYEPSEFTFTAMAGTPVAELSEALAARGQYLPFDPMLVKAGSTIGGTVASGLSGSGRFRFGGIRDFILGVQFIDGTGRALRLGGKVVKNAAGFDLPKFFVGSLGRFGILAELTFKVFPRPKSFLTLLLPVKDAKAAAQVMIEAASARWEIDAMDLLPDGKTLCFRLAGPAGCLEKIATEIFSRWPGQSQSDAEAGTVWSDIRECAWTHTDGPLVKVATTPLSFPMLADAIARIRDALMHVGSGGNLSLISLKGQTDVAELEEILGGLNLAGISLRGDGPLWLGASARGSTQIASAVKQALDPENRFPGLHD